MFLLPHRFKKIGAYAAPLGFAVWLCMQFGLVAKLAFRFGITDLFTVHLIIGGGSFISFLLGVYTLTFSKEKVEDEMIKAVRYESFHFAALVQIFFLIIGMLTMGFMKNPPKDGGLELFFVLAISIFWLSYLLRFNYYLHFRGFRNDQSH